MKKSFWKKLNNLCGGDESFTLVELLVVIGILAILTAAVFLVINPVEYLKQARDTTRMSDLDSIDKALAVLETQGITSFGTALTVYVSIADNASSTCGSLGLPSLPSGYAYACVTSANLQKINATGWIPVDFTQSPALSLAALPIDPVNATSTGNYYTYVTGGSWELTAAMEASKTNQSAINDGDSFPGVYSISSSSASLTPGLRDRGLVGYWTFEEGSYTEGQPAYDMSGNGNNGTWYGSGNHLGTGKVGNYAGQFNGSNDYVNVPDTSSLNVSGSFTLTAWLNLSSSGEVFAKTSTYYAHPFDVQFSGCNGNIYFLTGRGSGGYDNVLAASSFPCGTWKFISLIFDGAKLSAYVNGVQTLVPTDITQAVQNSANPFRIGSRGSTDNFGGGLQDDVRVYNRALSVAEIQAIYSATK